MIGHDDEGMELKAALGSVAEEDCEHYVGGRGALEDAVTLMGYGGDGEGFAAGFGHGW